MSITTNAMSAIVNFNSFSIGINELVKIQQLSAAGRFLGRVVVTDPSNVSNILGGLQSNGQVFLLNPNGIVFGASARIDVGGLVASSLALSNQDFLDGKMRFTAVPGAGAVVNQAGSDPLQNGYIQTTTGGRVYLIAPSVENTGVISAPQGEIVLAAGKSVELITETSPYVTVNVVADAGQAVNLGKLIADSGRIGMFGALVRHAGVAEAGSAVAGPGGSIRFVATKDLTIEAGSRISANGTTGGDVLLQAKEGTNLIAGTVEATGSEGQGGTIHALGVRVGVIGSGVIDASGETGGGTVLVGGDFQGKNADIQNAERTYVSPDGVIRADARTTGDGGRVIVWADGDTRFYGKISARGGNEGGDGGFVEVSGKQHLTYRGTVDTRAPKGKIGTLLLDPNDIIIYGGSGNGNDDYSGTGDESQLGAFTYGQEPGTIFESELEAQGLMSFVSVIATNSITMQAMSDGELFLSYGGSFSAGAGGITMQNTTNTIRTDGWGLSFSASGPITLGHLNTGFGSTWNSTSQVSISGGSISTGNILTGSASTFYGASVILNSSTGGISAGVIQTGSAGEGTSVQITSAGGVSTSSITTGTSDSNDSGVYIAATGNVVTGAITTGNAFFAESVIDIDASGSVTTGALTTGMSLDGCGDGCEGRSWIAISASGDVSTGAIRTGATGAAGWQVGDSSVGIDAGGDVSTGDITTGNSLGEFYDGTGARTTVTIQTGGAIATGHITTGNISFVFGGGNHESRVNLQSFNGGNITTGNIKTGSVDGGEGASGASSVQISSAFGYGGRVVTGSIMTGSVFSSGGGQTSSYVSIQSGLGGIQTGGIVTGTNTITGCCGEGDTGVYLQTQGSVVVAGNVTTANIDGTEGGFTMAMLTGSSVSVGNVTTGNAGFVGSSSGGLSGVLLGANNGGVTAGNITVGFGPDGGEAQIFAWTSASVGNIVTQGGDTGFVSVNAGASGVAGDIVTGAIVTRGTQPGQNGGMVDVRTGDGYGGGIGNIRIAGIIDTSGAAGAFGGGFGGYGGNVLVKAPGIIAIGPTPQFGVNPIAINTSGGAGGAGDVGQMGGNGGNAGNIVIDPLAIFINGAIKGQGGAGGAGGAGAAGGAGGFGAFLDMFAGTGGVPIEVLLQLGLTELADAASPGTIRFINGPASKAELLAALAGGAGGVGSVTGLAGTNGDATISGLLLAFIQLIDPLSIPAVLQAVGNTIEETQDAVTETGEGESEDDKRKKSFASCRPSTT